MTQRRITSAAPSITQQEIDLVTEAISEGWQSKMSLYIDQFTKEFSQYIGVKHCLTTAHCTDAIHLSMLSLGILSDFAAFIADRNRMLLSGSRPPTLTATDISLPNLENTFALFLS